MEQQINELMTLLKEMQASNTSIIKALEENTGAPKEVSSWKPSFHSKVGKLQASIKDLHTKIEQILLIQEKPNPSCKVFDVEHINLTKPAAAHLGTFSSEAASGQHGHISALFHGGLDMGWLPPLCRPGSQVRKLPTNSLLCLSPLLDPWLIP